jgi:hypothetical protein
MKMDAKIIDTIQESLFGLLGIGLSFMALFIIYKAIQMKNKERLALIEKGMDPSLAEAKPNSNRLNNLKNGLLLIGIVAGVISGYLLNITLNIPNIIAYSVMIFIFCGVLLLYFHNLTKKML